MNKFRIMKGMVLTFLMLAFVQVALAHDGLHDEPVPVGGDSLFPWVVIFLTFIAMGLAAAWMFRRQ